MTEERTPKGRRETYSIEIPGTQSSFGSVPVEEGLDRAIEIAETFSMLYGKVVFLKRHTVEEWEINGQSRPGG